MYLVNNYIIVHHPQPHLTNQLTEASAASMCMIMLSKCPASTLQVVPEAW